MYRKVMLSLTLLCLILLTLIAWKVGVFTTIAGLPFFPLVEKIITNTYFSGVSCSIIGVVIIYKWQVWYSQRKLKQDFRCNECIEDIYDGIETVGKYAPLVPKEKKETKTVIAMNFARKMHRNMLAFIWNTKAMSILRIWHCRMKETTC